MINRPGHHGTGHQPRDHGATHHPRYRGTDEGAVGEPRTARQRWAVRAVIIIVAALVLAIVIMHLTGANPMKGSGL